MAVGAKRKATVSPAKGKSKKVKGVQVEKSTMIFLKHIKKNNDADWLKEHKGEFEAAKDNFAELTEAVLARMKEVDDFVVEACGDDVHDYIERINNKFPTAEAGPYNPFLSFHIVPKGQRKQRAGYTLRLQPFGHTTLVAGLEHGDGKTLTALRAGIAEDAAALTEAMEEEALEEEFGEAGAELLGEHGDPLTKAPKGFHKDHENIELLKNRRFVIVKTFADDEVLADTFLDEVVAAFTAAAPFVAELNSLIAAHEEGSDDEEEHEGNADESSDEEEED